MRYVVAVISLSILATGCGSIESQAHIAQPLGVERIAGVGDLVFRANTSQSLPNVFGRADIWGRTTPTGQTSVVYEGLQDGRIIFSRTSFDIETGATTMNSSPTVIYPSATTTASGMVGVDHFSGTATTTGAPIVLPPNSPTPRVSERSRALIVLEASELPKTFTVEGNHVRVLEADRLRVRYVIEPAK